MDDRILSQVKTRAGMCQALSADRNLKIPYVGNFAQGMELPRVDRPCVEIALNKLFLLINDGRGWDWKILTEKSEIEEIIKANCKEKSEKVIKDIDNLINPPLYSREKDKLKLKFWLTLAKLPEHRKSIYGEDVFSLSLVVHTFEIDKNLKISPPPDNLNVWVDFLKDCKCTINKYKNE